MRKRRSFRKVWRTPALCLDTSSTLRSCSPSRSASARLTIGRGNTPATGALRREQELQPRAEDLGIGQCREQVAIVAPLVALALLQLGAVERRAAVELLQLAVQHLAPVAAAGVRQRLEAVVLVDRVGHQVHRHARRWSAAGSGTRRVRRRRPRIRGSRISRRPDHRAAEMWKVDAHRSSFLAMGVGLALGPLELDLAQHVVDRA